MAAYQPLETTERAAGARTVDGVARDGGTDMLQCVVSETKDLEPVVYEWGAVKWVANNEVAPGCEQSFGLVHVLPGQTNPEHWHTAAEEIVFMLQGECTVRVGD